MKKIIGLFILLCSFHSYSQRQISGVVKNEKGETMIGVKVFAKYDRKINALTDLNGNYLIKASDTTSFLVFKIQGFRTYEVNLNSLSDFSSLSSVVLETNTKSLKTVTVSGRPVKSNEVYMENVKKNSSTTIDFISAETIKKTGDQNVVAAVSRVSGVSQSGGLITVRGIGDRYVKTTLNGSRIPTLDPLTNNIKLDIFPSSLIDNIIITKTASPDLPGDFSGAYLSVETKEYPSTLQVNLESQFTYNAQTTFKDVITSQQSGTDWIGYDNGLRTKHSDNFISPNLSPTTYQEMSALGLKGYYNSIGVTDWKDGSPEGNTYFKLGLVQLGLLSKSDFDNTTAINNARQKFDNEYSQTAFNHINPNGTNYSNGFANNWNYEMKKAPINFSQNFSVGNQTKLFGKTFGFLVGFRYGNSLRYDPYGVSQRLMGDTSKHGYDTRDNARISRKISGWNALVNLSYKFNPKNALSFMFMPNISGTNDVVNFNTISDGTVSQEVTNRINQFYEQRKQLVYQLKSTNTLFKKVKTETNLSYTNGNSIAPDFKVLQYVYSRNNGTDSSFDYLLSPTAGDGIRRYYRYLNENLLDSRFSGEIPFLSADSSVTRKLKFGVAYQRLDRKSDLEEYYMVDGNNPKKEMIDNQDVNTFLNTDKFTMKNDTIDYFYSKREFDRNHTFGNSAIKAAFVMMDYPFKSGLRLAGGVRVEQAKIFTDVVAYNANGYAKNDIRRENTGGFALVNPANINETNVLPSLNMVYTFKKITKADINARLNYSQTVARPSIRELNDAAVYDNEFRTLVYGNSDLKTVHVKNYDFRAESYFKNKDQLSVSLFYKDFTNHIEMGFGSAGITWQNIDKSTVQGLEFEGKKNLGEIFSINANVTLVKSVSSFIRKDMQIVNGIKQYTNLDTLNRPMFGQAPYVVNAIFNAKFDSLKLNFTVSYNVQGPRLAITGVVKGFPDVYEMPRHTIDFKVSKTFGKRITTSLMARDILNARVRRAYKMNNGWIDYDNYRYGTNYMLSVAYKF